MLLPEVGLGNVSESKVGLCKRSIAEHSEKHCNASRPSTGRSCGQPMFLHFWAFQKPFARNWIHLEVVLYDRMTNGSKDDETNAFEEYSVQASLI